MKDQVGPSVMQKHKKGKIIENGKKQLILHCFNALSGSESRFEDIGFFMFEPKSKRYYHELMI
jgi:hypothetical protein